MWIEPIIAVSEPAPIKKSFNARLSMYESVDRDCELVRLNQRSMIQTEQMSMPTDNQKGKAPPPGPSSGIQPTGSSALFHIRKEEKITMITAVTSSARRILVIPSPSCSRFDLEPDYLISPMFFNIALWIFFSLAQYRFSELPVKNPP